MRKRISWSSIKKINFALSASFNYVYLTFFHRATSYGSNLKVDYENKSLINEDNLLCLSWKDEEKEDEDSVLCSPQCSNNERGIESIACFREFNLIDLCLRFGFSIFSAASLRDEINLFSVVRQRKFPFAALTDQFCVVFFSLTISWNSIFIFRINPVLWSRISVASLVCGLSVWKSFCFVQSYKSFKIKSIDLLCLPISFMIYGSLSKV